jgi:enoyl-CoA hydratase/carnithine racemase
MPEAASSSRVTCVIRDGVADVRLNRPEKLNALDGAMFDALVQTGELLRDDTAVRAVVISGEGRGFCAGLDLASLMTMAGGEGQSGATDVTSSLGRRVPGRITNQAQQVAYVWSELAVPTIAAIHGVALGGGLQIALAADLRFVAPDARLSVLEIRWGLVPDMTGTHFLPRLVGLDVAKELTWTGRMVEAPEAARIGLVTQIHADPRGAALAFAADVAAHSPEAIRGAKALLNRSAAADQAQQFVAESEVMGSLIGSANQVEAVHAFIEKRTASFSDFQPGADAIMPVTEDTIPPVLPAGSR